jgi:hypothetical protein
VIERAEAGGPPPRATRPHCYDAVTDLVAVRSDKPHGKISAKRLLPIARAAGYQGSDRNSRRLVVEQKVLWRIATAHCRLPGVWDRHAHAARPAGRTKPHVTELCQPQHHRHCLHRHHGHRALQRGISLRAAHQLVSYIRYPAGAADVPDMIGPDPHPRQRVRVTYFPCR